MRDNQSDTPRQQAEQPQGRQQQGRQPQGQPPTQQPSSYQQPPQQPPQNTQQQPPQSMQSSQGRPPQGQQSRQPPSQGQPQPPQSGRGRPSQRSQQIRPPQQSSPGMQGGPQSPPQQTGMQAQGQMQQMSPQMGVGGRRGQQMGGRGSHLHSVTIDDILQSDVVTAEPDTPLPTVTAKMKSEDVGAVVVVEDDEPLSLLTDRKIALSLEEMPDLAEKTAQDVMSGDVVTGSDSMSVYEALQQLSDENIRRLPITDDDDKLVGIVTLDDIIVLIGTELQDVAEIIQAQSPRL